ISASSSSSGKLADPTTTPWDPPAVSGLELLELLLLELPLLPQAASTTLVMTARPPSTPLFRGKALALTGETGNMVFISFHSDRFRTLSCEPRLLTQASRHEEPTQADEQDLDRKGEHHHERGAPGHLAVVVDRQPVDDVAAKATQADVRGDRRGGYHEDRPRPQAEHDQRKGDRNLDFAHLLPRGHAHAPGRVLDLRVNTGHPFVGIDQDRRDRENHEGEQPRQWREAQRDHGEHEKAEGRDRPPGIRDVDDDQRAPPGMPYENAERPRDERRDQQGQPAVPELLQDPDRYPAGTVPLRGRAQPVPGVAQEAHAAPTPPGSCLAARPSVAIRISRRAWPACQGVSSLRATTSRTSQTSASAMMSTRPTMISVGKLRWYPSMNRYPRLLTPMSWPTLARLMLETVAIRSPAITMGTAIGSSTWTMRRSVPKPMAVAACRTGSGTARSPSTTFGSRTHSENSVSGMITVVSVSPVYGISTMNRASDGSAYSTLVADSTGGYSHPQRTQAIPSGTEITRPSSAGTMPR